MPAGIDPHEQAILDRDRLPWLETVDEDLDGGPSLLRIALLVGLALVLVAAAILAYQWYRQQRVVDGNGELIAAQEGDYKVRPDDPGGLKVEGEGDTAIATSNGAGMSNAAIDLNAAPETPVAGKRAAPSVAAKGARTVVADLPGVAASGGSLVQLGSFPDEAAANTAWSMAAKRLTWLAPFGKSVQAAQIDGRTMYRLRVNAGSAGQATALCGRLKAAGEPCFVPTS